jgi:hypothetical protein
MKRRTSGLLALVVILMILMLGVGSALAVMAAPYYSWCTADTDVSSDSGDSYAYAFDNPNDGAYYASAESIAIAWGLGAKAHVIVNDNFAGTAYAHAEFTQQFVVTAAGAASINFSYD